MNKLDTKQFIDNAKSVHGDKYDYSKTVYEKAKKKVLITCKKHGDFLQTPDNHVNGSGCRKCSLEKAKHLTHGLSKDPLYRVWIGMMRRCKDTKWSKSYIKKGIKVSENLSSVEYFIEYAKTIEGYDKFINSNGYTLDRIDTYKDYEEGNLRFADYSIQSINQRLRKNNKTGYVGIHIYKNGYMATVEHNGVKMSKKPFVDIQDAINWRNEVIISNNFPNKINIYKNEKKAI